MEINQYPLERFTFGDDDFYDIDYWDGSQFLTAKIKGSVIKAGIAAAAANIYTADGTLSGDRTLTGSNFILFFQTLGQFIVHSHKNNTDNIIFEVKSDPTYHGFIIRDHNTGVHMLACRDGKVEISDAYFLPDTAGNAGDVLTSDGAGNSSWQPVVVTNIYNSDGTLGGARVMTMNGNYLTFDGQSGDSVIQLQATNSAVLNFLRGTGFKAWAINKDVDGSENLKIDRFDGTGSYLDTPIEIDKSTGQIQFNGAYKFPTVPGFPDAVLMLDAFGELQWVGLADISIYTANGALTGNRFVDLGDFFLQFEGLDSISGGSNIFRLAWNEIYGLVGDALGNNSGINITDAFSQLFHNQGATNRRVRVDQNGFQINGAYYMPNADGTAGQILQTNGLGQAAWVSVAGMVEKKIDSFYAFDMSQAQTYTWNGVANIGPTTLVTLNERTRLQTFAGTGGADGCFVNSILPSYYVSGSSIRVDLVVTENGAGGNIKYFVGLNKPSAGNAFSGAADTQWLTSVHAAAAGFNVVKISLTFAGTNLSAGEPIGVLVFRDPGDAQDTFTGDSYINSINIEQV